MTDVTVVGGGIIGLTAAIRLRERGARVRVISADEARDTVSAVAAAVWYPARTAADERVLRWSAEALAEFTRQAADGAPGVRLVPTRGLLRTPIDGLPWWAPATSDAVLEPGDAPYVQQVRFTAPAVEMEPYLAWLGRDLTIERRRVTGFGDLGPVVVNATGLAAGRLAGDRAVHPARGHIVLVDNPGVTESVRDEEHPDGMTYVHPRSRDVVLGGTYQPDRGDTDPDPAEAEAIVRRCVGLVPELAGARVRGARIGLRPARRGGPRLEAVDVEGVRVVHAYGHGGAGMTMSWGCADEIAGLALA